MKSDFITQLFKHEVRNRHLHIRLQDQIEAISKNQIEKEKLEEDNFSFLFFNPIFFWQKRLN
jgi:hypothetical protein